MSQIRFEKCMSYSSAFVDQTPPLCLSLHLLSKSNQFLGWQDGPEECTLASNLSNLGFNSDTAINGHPGVSPMCVPSIRWTLNWPFHLLVLVAGR